MAGVIGRGANENWDSTVKFSEKYEVCEAVKRSRRKIGALRYIHLYAAAGKVSEGRMSFDELERLLKQFIGKEVVLPYRPKGFATVSRPFRPDGSGHR